MKRLLFGSAITVASIVAGPSYLAQSLLLTVARVSLFLNEQTMLMMSLFLLLTMNRMPMLISTAWGGVKTRFTNMHFFIAGAALLLVSIIVFSLFPGAFIVTTLTSLFSGNTISLTGFQLIQGILFVLGVVFVIFDFPYGHARMRRM